ncbi:MULTISPECIES: adenosylcobinamide-GDP ribazoletransferase [unclassified Thioalkalivibrio]|uniref:adenosylcobinamide-GDP ribazoletransferase n=1 Tax=unclassified Thioalkalivibrio TaxID=2621013 RepID=UPI0003751C3C|nr:MULTISPECIES: adenosylcobinamide-GDP ribazoletransferase [unclassified Thioalkalivibrio]
MSRPATLAPLWLALVFLTRVPLPARLLPEAPRPEDAGRSLLFYPLVGLVLGLLLAGGGMLLSLLPGAEPLLLAALVLAGWVAITGALHLDGLADTVDARVGSHGDPERARTIMKDPTSGPIAVATVMLVLLVKFAALVPLVAAAQWLALVIAAVLGRAALVLLFRLADYLNPAGLGADMAAHLPERAAAGVLVATAIAVVILGVAGGLPGAIIALILAGATVAALAAFFRRWLGGFTGDPAGATLEIVETVALVVMALSLTA